MKIESDSSGDVYDEAGMCQHLNSLWLVFANQRVMCLDIQTRRWTDYKNTLKEHDYPGCLVARDYLYIFS